MAILKIKNENGEFINIPSIVGPKGDIGPQGIQGIQGETGPQGPQGETGPQGESGTTNYNELTNIPIIQLTGTQTNPIIIRNLESGLYIIKGYKKLNSSEVLSAEITDSELSLIKKNPKGTRTLCICFSSGSKDIGLCFMYEITDTEVKSCTITDTTPKIGNLYYLTTTDKTSLVNAVNEVNAQIGDINTILATLTEVSE